MKVFVLTTGGTIGAEAYPDPLHAPENATMPTDGRDLVREKLERDFAAQCRCLSLPPRDSKLIDSAYRDTILRLAAAAPEERILITHGTDTILTSADYLYLNAAAELIERKTILLTGAMTPLANGAESDGYWNLKFALDYLAGSPGPGVGIVLCDYSGAEKGREWRPQLYPYAPDRYEKYYDRADSRYCRLRPVG